MSPLIVPAKISGSLYQENNDTNNDDVKQKVIVSSPGQQFEDSSGDLPENYEKTVEEQLEGMTKEENKRLEGGSDVKSGSESSVEETGMNLESENMKFNEGDNPVKRSGDEMMDIRNNGDDNEVKYREKEQIKDENSEIKEKDGSNTPTPISEKVEQNQDKKSKLTSSGEAEPEKKVQDADDFLPKADRSEILKETTTQNGAWSTQAMESQNEKKSQEHSVSMDEVAHIWKICNTTAGPDYIPCLDNWQVIRRLPDIKHFQHRERHCPGEAPTCLVPLPKGYKKPVPWPKSRDKVFHLYTAKTLFDLFVLWPKRIYIFNFCQYMKLFLSQIWFYNVPHTKLADVKGHQNWVKVSGEYLTFPGGGTQFIHGASGYINLIEKVRLCYIYSANKFTHCFPYPII